MGCGTFLEGKMESKNKKDAVADRRDFLKRSAVSVAAAGAVAVAGKAASASEVEVPSGAGYRETEHVKAFYASARF
jgi:nitrous oxide reductase